jgi:hypothetical protein
VRSDDWLFAGRTAAAHLNTSVRGDRSSLDRGTRGRCFRVGKAVHQKNEGIAHLQTNEESPFAASLLGGSALADGVAGWDWLAMALLLAIGGLIAFLLWPYHNYRFRFDAQDPLDRYVDTGATMAAMHRELAMRIKHDMAANWRVIQLLRIALQLALVLLVFEILAWLLAIAPIR